MPLRFVVLAGQPRRLRCQEPNLGLAVPTQKALIQVDARAIRILLLQRRMRLAPMIPALGEMKWVQLTRPQGFSCCHLQVHRLIRQDFAAFPLSQACSILALKPTRKFLPITIQLDAAQV